MPRLLAPITRARMLASTAVIASPTRKKKNSVSAPLHSAAILSLLHVERRARLRRFPCRSRGRARTRPLNATGTGRGDAERDGQPWGRRPGRSASPSGIRLSRIPSCQAFSQVTKDDGGSTGIPDSLDTKRVSTSGPAAVSPVVTLVVGCAQVHSAHPIRLVLAHIFPLGNSCPRFLYSRPAFFALSNRDPSRSDLRKCLQETDASSPSGSPKFAEIDAGNLLRTARDRVTFVVSPGIPENRNQRIHEWGPLCATPMSRPTLTEPPPRFAAADGPKNTQATTPPQPPPTRTTTPPNSRTAEPPKPAPHPGKGATP